MSARKFQRTICTLIVAIAATPWMTLMAANPPPKKAPQRVQATPVVRPVIRQGVPGAKIQGKPGVPQATGTARVVGAPANTVAGGATREQLMQSVRPAFSNASLHQNLHAVSRSAFEKPANIRHDPLHRLGHFGEAHRHSPFVFARRGHRFYRRYYILDGYWFWYDEPVASDDPAADADLSALPTCDPNADECQGDVPIAGVPPPGEPTYAPSDPVPGQ
jgi:hypothetical protein